MRVKATESRLPAITRIGFVALAVILVACGGAQPVAPSQAFAMPSPSTAANAYAQKVLSQAVIPPGARAISTSHSDFLKEPFETVATEGLIDVHSIYVVDELPGAVLTYITTHIPQGALLVGTGTLGSPNGDAHGIDISIPRSGPNENYAELVYEVASYQDRSSELRVDAQVVWVPNRSDDELVPSGATVEVTGFAQTSAANDSSGPVTIKLTPAQAESLTIVANSLPLAPPPACMENPLLYKVVFRPSAPPSGSFELDGYDCPKTVFVSKNGIALFPLNDAGCRLLAAVVSVLPEGQGAGTRSALTGSCE
jgi:hypothetical protein